MEGGRGARCVVAGGEPSWLVSRRHTRELREPC